MPSLRDWLTKGTVISPPLMGFGLLAWGGLSGGSTFSELVIPALILILFNPVLAIARKSGLSRRSAGILWYGNYLLPGVYFVALGLIDGSWLVLLSGIMAIGFGLAGLGSTIDKKYKKLIGHGTGILGFILMGVYTAAIEIWWITVSASILVALFIWDGVGRPRPSVSGDD